MKLLVRSLSEIDVPYGPCFTSYETGDQYLVLIHRNDNEAGAFPFANSERTEAAADSIAFFRALARGEHLTILKGRLAANVDDNMVDYELDVEHRPGLPGVEITASLEGQHYKTTSSSTGVWELRVPGPGTYQLSASLPGHASTKPSYELEVAPDSCAELNMGLWTAGKLTGRLITGSDQSPKGIRVQLARASDVQNYPPHSITDADGTFEFTNIPPGEYILGVNVTGANSKVPYTPRFYPGVSNRTTAEIIKINGPQTIEHLDFVPGERRPTRRIEIQVRWPDGRPVINADVACDSTSNDPDQIVRDGVWRYVDVEGKATCEVLADEDFRVEAQRLSWKSSSRPIQPIKTRQSFSVPAGTNTVRLTLVIDSINDISGQEAPVNMAPFNDQDDEP